MWVTDNPWPPFFLLVISAGLMFWRWSQMQAGRGWLIGAGCLLIAAGGVHLIDSLVVTDAEIVEQNVHELVTAFQKKDLPKTKSYLAPTIQPLAVPSLISSAMTFVQIHGDIDVKDLQVEMQRGKSVAISRFRANATVSTPGYQQQHQPSRWELAWERIGGEWKIVRVTRLDYISDREVSLLYPLTGEMQPAVPARRP